MVARVNFTECAAIYRRDPDLQKLWHWPGPLIGLNQTNATQISLEGCRHLCGTGTAYYPWSEVSSTLTTWILPVVGTLLQAPFESNATSRTFLAITRWIGSPIASISYVLWNIKVSAKAALMVDMAVKYDETPHRKTDFGSIRDSMFLLLVMNQYALKPDVVQHSKKEAECLLRIALFSRDLKLTDTDESLRTVRYILAQELREMRRRGAVPVFVSIMWFLFAFALSVETAFGSLGQNTTAHDLALGCLLAWFPILIMGSIVDRNPIAAEAIRKKLNHLVDHVRNALRDDANRRKFIETFRDHPEFKKLEARVESMADAKENVHEFFEEFAGQARVRWHYGAAHPILSDIEDCYIAHKGRNWLADERDARMNLVLGTVNDEGLMWFDIREFWQILSAVIIVGGSCGGAFILSYFTPTVGLGCRSGGYTIFFSISLGLMIVEMAVWLVTSPYEMRVPWLVWLVNQLRRSERFCRWELSAQARVSAVKRRASSFGLKTENKVIEGMVWLAMIVPGVNKRMRKTRVKKRLEERAHGLRELSTQKRWERFFFRPVELFNTIWLIYIVLAQTFGWYKTCNCVTSTWGGAGGYLDFSVQDTANSRWVLYYWTAGTCLTAIVMLWSIAYITVEWCQQSFLSTESYSSAMDGLRMTRDYRALTYCFRALSRFISRFTFDPLESLGVKFGLIKTRQKTLVWTKKHTYDPKKTKRPPPSASPSIELTIPLDDFTVRETPALAHSLFPPARTTRVRGESDATFSEHALPIYEMYRVSDESARWSIQRPGDVHRSRVPSTGRSHRTSGERERRQSSEAEGSRGSGEFLLSPPEGAVFGVWEGAESMVQSRQGYKRNNSDPGMPPFDLDGDARGLGLGVDERGGAGGAGGASGAGGGDGERR